MSIRLHFNVWTIVVGIVLLLNTSMLFAQGSPNVTLLANVNDYAAAGYNDCWGYTAPDGREYALLGVENGTSIIDITDTDNPTEINFISSPNTTWKDIKTYQHYAYVVVDAAAMGLQIIDLSDLPNSAPLINTYTGSGFGASHNIYIDEASGILYAQGGGGTRIISLANPESPTQLTVFASPNTHDVYVQDNVAFISDGWDFSFSLFDVSNPASPQWLQTIPPPSSGYGHNAWATEDGNYLLTTEEVPGGLTVKMWDIQDLGNISLTDEYIASATGRPHNALIKGDYAYISHYWDGVRIVDISDPNNIAETGFYDTYPGDGSVFEGCWGTYPFFASGKILASDRSTGLYVLFFDGAIEGQESTFNESVENGWNLVGLPNDPQDHHYQSLFPNAIEGSLFSFDGAYVEESSLTVGKGYWLRFPGQETVPITGAEITAVTTDLAEGWNIISGISGDMPLANMQDPGNIIIAGSLFGFNGSYFSTNTIEQGKGYWIQTNAPGQITLDLNSAPASSKIFADAATLDGYPSLHFQESASDFQQTLYFNVNIEDSHNKTQYRLPPIGPAGSFDARFSDGYRINESDNALINIQSRNPVLIKPTNLPQDILSQFVIEELAGNAVLKTHPLREGETIIISNPQVNRLKLSNAVTTTIPQQFALLQNFPNPFNPSTTLAFQLLQDSQISLTIYNAAGQEVRTLVNKSFAAGTHQVEWDGRDNNGNLVSSGIYLYRMSAVTNTGEDASQFNQVRKMVLMK